MDDGKRTESVLYPFPLCRISYLLEVILIGLPSNGKKIERIQAIRRTDAKCGAGIIHFISFHAIWPYVIQSTMLYGRTLDLNREASISPRAFLYKNREKCIG